MKKVNTSIRGQKLIPIKLIIVYSVLALILGLASFAFIAVINEVISLSLSSESSIGKDYLYIFLGIILIFFITKRWLSGGIISLSQSIYWKIRNDLIQLIMHAPYRQLQKFRDEVYTTLTADVGHITNASLMIINFFSSIILIISCLIYMAYLSLTLFAISLSVIIMAVLIYLYRSKKGDQQFREARELEGSFMNIFNSILDGAKEININPAKGKDIYNKKMVNVIDLAEQTNVKAFLHFLNTELISQLSFYSLITFILVFSNTLLGVSLSINISFVFVLLYLLGPIVSVMGIIPGMGRALISLKKINHLKIKLQNLQHQIPPSKENVLMFQSFDQIRLGNYEFSFGESKFAVGPINLDIQRGEVIFIYGGNGAGKTTFINTLLKLYDIDCGDISVDKIKVLENDVHGIKEIFSVVFSDFYLFDEFYGIAELNQERVEHYLKIFELDTKVSIENNGFSTTHLSTGQRKRLALISALAEERPVLVLDEWAADQDPIFRKKFYTEIIPMINRDENKTIIAITHDDKYYHVADRLLKMEYGQLIEVKDLKTEIALKDPA